MTKTFEQRAASWFKQNAYREWLTYDFLLAFAKFLDESEYENPKEKREHITAPGQRCWCDIVHVRCIVAPEVVGAGDQEAKPVCEPTPEVVYHTAMCGGKNGCTGCRFGPTPPKERIDWKLEPDMNQVSGGWKYQAEPWERVINHNIVRIGNILERAVNLLTK